MLPLLFNSWPIFHGWLPRVKLGLPEQEFFYKSAALSDAWLSVSEHLITVVISDEHVVFVYFDVFVVRWFYLQQITIVRYA